MFNVVGEIRGTDKADEVVMLGAHFDSWHASTGATDNAAGSAAMLEAMRILKQSGVHAAPHGADRSVDRRGAGPDRIARSTCPPISLRAAPCPAPTDNAAAADAVPRRRAAVAVDAVHRDPLEMKPDHAKFAGLLQYRQRHGRHSRRLPAGQRRGRSDLPRMDGAVPQPRHDVPDDPEHRRDRSSVLRSAWGCPGFQFIQDEVEYDTMTHHTNLDSYERLQPSDMMKNATIAAAFAYLTANRDEKLPRNPLPVPATGRGSTQ